MNGEILLSFRVGRPFIAETAHVMAELVADTQRIGWRHLQFQRAPALTFRRCDGSPVPPSEGNEILSAHSKGE